MRKTTISVPEFVLVAGTRVLLGCGIGFLLSERLERDQKKALGWAFLGIGILSTIPLGMEIFGGGRLTGGAEEKMLEAGQKVA